MDHVFGSDSGGAFLARAAFLSWISGALYPVVSGALVIMAGRTNSRWGVDRWLVSKPLQSLGTFLRPVPVHWPILILQHRCRETPRIFLKEPPLLRYLLA